MKKIIGIVSGIFLLIIGGGIFFFLLYPKPGKVTLESVLPAQPVFYLRVMDLNSRIEKFTSTKLFTALKSLDYKNLALNQGVSKPLFEQAQSYGADIFSPENQKIFKALFGQELVVAVYADKSLKELNTTTSSETPELFSQLAGNVFVATRVSADFTAAQTLLKVLGMFSKDFKTDTLQYNGKAIEVISNKQGTLRLAYVRFKDIIVMGFDVKAAKAAIDVLAKKQKALVTDEKFVERQRHFSTSADTVGFLDIQAISAIISVQVAELSKNPSTKLYARELNESLRQTQGLEDLVFENTTQDILTTKINVSFDKAKLRPAMQSLYSCAGDNNSSAQFVPLNAFYYQWSTCLDFPVLWNSYKEQLVLDSKAMGRPLDIDAVIGSYEKMLGLSIDKDILPSLGKEFGIYATDIQTTGTFPVPQMAVFVQITDRQKVTALIDKLLALQPSLQIQEENYGGQVIHFIPIPLVESFKISYTFVDNYFLLATSVEILKESLDAAKNPPKAIAFNSVLHGAPQKTNALLFVELDRLLDKAVDVVDWVSQMSKQAQIQRQAFINGGQKNIDDIRLRNEDLKALIETKKKNLAQIESVVDQTSEITTQKDALKKDIESIQKEIAANDDRVKSISTQIKAFEDKAPKEEADTALAEQFVKPLLRALSHIKYLFTTTNNGQGVLQSTIRLKLE